jgi:hypothetical protein
MSGWRMARRAGLIVKWRDKGGSFLAPLMRLTYPLGRSLAPFLSGFILRGREEVQGISFLD